MGNSGEGNESAPQFELEEVVNLEPESLTDEHKTFLEENKGDLTPEQADKFGITQEAAEEEEDIDLDKIEPETKGKKVEKKEDITTPKGKKDEKDEEDEEIDPEDEKKISKVLQKHLTPLQEREKEREAEFQALKDEKEVDSLISAKPEYAKYRGAALKYMAHPAYANIPAHNIMAIVASKDLQSIGAKKEREAARAAKETQGNTSTTRKQPAGKIDWHNVSKDDFEAQKAKVLGRSGQ